MIECCDEKIYKKRHKKSKKLRRFFVCFIIVVSILICYFYSNIVCENVFSIITEKCYSLSTEAVNESVKKSSAHNVNYENLINVEKNNSGEIVAIKANSSKINYISREIEAMTKSKLEDKLKNGIPIPFMAFSGIKALSGYGKLVNVKTIGVNSVVCNFESEFKSAGLNQTLHSIYIDILITTITALPIKSYTKTCNSKVLICETVIVGKVPEMYFNGQLIG